MVYYSQLTNYIWPTLVLILTFSITNHGFAANGKINPRWVVTNLPSADCGGHKDCHRSSPAIADVDGDGRDDIVIATSNGHVRAYKDAGSSGSLLWSVDIAGPFGMNSNTHEINASPAVADIDQDGRVEIVIGAGAVSASKCTQGGVIVIEHNGQIKPGWPFKTRDIAIAPDGCADSVYGTTALGDLDKDGDLEIVFGSFDKGIYAMEHTGQVRAGFPVNSAHLARFGWPNLVGRTADTIWSSPSLADIDQDGFLDIVIGTDEGNFSDTHGGRGVGWSCPYTLPAGWPTGYCGGSLYAVDRFGSHLPGFPRYILETIQSSPITTDIDTDGDIEIFVGTGAFYNTFSPSHPTNGFRLFGFDHQGNDLPGWEGGKVVGGTVPASPVIGDIAGDGNPEIIVAAMDKKLYAWHHNGTPVSGFPMTPLTEFGTTGNFDVDKSFILFDYDGDSKMEIGFAHSWGIAIVDGNGAQITTSSFPDSDPLYYADGLQLNTPAVGDVDGDGILELVASNSRLLVWDLPDVAREADWPMHRNSPLRTATVVPPSLQVAPHAVTILTDNRNNTGTALLLTSNAPTAVNWSATPPNRVQLSQTNGSLLNSQTVNLQINTSGLGTGAHALGNLSFNAMLNGNTIATNPTNLPVNVIVVDELYQSFLPLIQKN